MKKKILALILLSVLSASLIAGCSLNGGAPAGDGEEQTQQAEQTEEKETEKPAKKTNKGKYDNIDADSVPIGVDEIEFINSKSYDGTTYVHIKGRIYKNGGDIKESYVGVTFEIYDENGERIGEKTVSPNDSMAVGDDARFEDTISLNVARDDGMNVPDETVAEYTAKIIDIKEKDAEEASLEAAITDIETAIKWDKEYDKAQILLDAALKQYPDNTDLKLLQAELDAEKAKNAG